MRASFSVAGEPTGKARPRVTRTGHAYTPEKTVLYENLIKMEYESQCGDAYCEKDVPVALSISAFYGIPKSATKRKREEMLAGEIRPTKKPDADNLAKLVGDALNGIAYYDDSQIVQCYVEKFYSDKPRVDVIVRSFE